MTSTIALCHHPDLEITSAQTARVAIDPARQSRGGYGCNAYDLADDGFDPERCRASIDAFKVAAGALARQ